MIFIWNRVLKKVGINNFGQAIFILLMGGTYWWSIKVYYSGMETPLVTLFIGLSILAYNKYDSNKNNLNAILLGTILALTFLSRLDSIFFVFWLLIFWVYRTKKINSHHFLAGLTFTIIISPYLLWNIFEFNNIVPVSGIVKSRSDSNDLSIIIFRLKILLVKN